MQNEQKSPEYKIAPPNLVLVPPNMPQELREKLAQAGFEIITIETQVTPPPFTVERMTLGLQAFEHLDCILCKARGVRFAPESLPARMLPGHSITFKAEPMTTFKPTRLVIDGHPDDLRAVEVSVFIGPFLQSPSSQPINAAMYAKDARGEGKFSTVQIGQSFTVIATNRSTHPIVLTASVEGDTIR